MNKQKSKCDFCKYYTGRSCMVTPDSNYCREALDEYYHNKSLDEYLQYLNKQKQQPQQRSLRSWDKK